MTPQLWSVVFSTLPALPDTHPSKKTGSVDESSCFEVWNLRLGRAGPSNVGWKRSESWFHGFRFFVCLVIKQRTTVYRLWFRTKKSSLPGEMIEFWRASFSNGLVQPPTRQTRHVSWTTFLTHHDSVKSGTLVWRRTRVVDTMFFFAYDQITYICSSARLQPFLCLVHFTVVHVMFLSKLVNSLQIHHKTDQVSCVANLCENQPGKKRTWVRAPQKRQPRFNQQTSRV